MNGKVTPTFLGFDRKPYAEIFWIKNGDTAHRTVCYNEQDIKDMFDKFVTPGSLYSDFDGYEINYIKDKDEAL